MTSPLVLRFQQCDDLAPDERDALEEISLRTRIYEAGAEIAAQGSRPFECCVLLDGFAARATLLSDGSRQIGAIHVPGDFIDIHSFVLKVMDHSLLAVTRCRVAVVPHTIVRKLADQFPHLARLFWLTQRLMGQFIESGLPRLAGAARKRISPTCSANFISG